jgi:hypothetical protein
MNPGLQTRYRSLVGSAQHPAITCRPDVAASVRTLAAHLLHPTQQHVDAAERVLQYLDHTKHLALEFHRTGTTSDPVVNTFYGTCDASYNVTHDSKGITGWSYQLADGSIAWQSKAQAIVSLSSTEAELIAIDAAARELRYLHKLLLDFGQQTSHRPTPIGQDNMSTITLCESRHFNARTKHVALRYHHVGDLIRAGDLILKYLGTEAMTADVLTKALFKKPHCHHRAVLLGHVKLLWTKSKS